MEEEKEIQKQIKEREQPMDLLAQQLEFEQEDD